MKATAIVGANYGDEGKGATVHAVVKASGAKWVVRHNGGPQAGHTVHLANGVRHVFSSFSSGSFAHANTYLAKTALVDPSAASREYYALVKVGYRPQLVIHPECEVTTPWDIALNQFCERGAGDKRNGSCGMGIGEAVARKLSGLSVPAKLLTPTDSTFILARNLQAHFREQVLERTKTGAFECLTLEEQSALRTVLENPTLLSSKFLSQISCINMFELATFEDVTSSYRKSSSPTVIFEGAQGLLLDENDPDHQPHVTWSKTGLDNVVEFCKGQSLELDSVQYCTRPYLTRHGNGPMLAGTETLAGWGKDLTNVPNPYQGTLRYGHLDWSKFKARVQAESTKTAAKAWVSLTCLDQMLDEYEFHHEGQVENIDPEELPGKLEHFLEMPVSTVCGLRM